METRRVSTTVGEASSELIWTQPTPEARRSTSLIKPPHTLACVGSSVLFLLGWCFQTAPGRKAEGRSSHSMHQKVCHSPATHPDNQTRRRVIPPSPKQQKGHPGPQLAGKIQRLIPMVHVMGLKTAGEFPGGVCVSWGGKDRKGHHC